MIKCRFFQIFELVPPSVYNNFDHEHLWRVFDNRLLVTFDRIRIRYNRTIYINDWYWGGIYERSGFRHFDCAVGAQLSDHKFGRAGDLKIEGVSSREVRQDIRDKPDIKAFEYITAVESQVSWLHIACANWDKSRHGILFFQSSR